VAALPNQWNVSASAGGQWAATFVLKNADGTPMTITNKTFEFVVRTTTATSGTVIWSVTSAVANAYGYMVIDTVAATVQVVLSPTATAAVPAGGKPFALWMDQALTDATCLVAGTFYANPVAQP
jgi:hypothetical protein